jgi:hypothetical protein
MGHLLPGSGAIGEEKVDSLAADIGPADRCRQSHAYLKYLAPHRLVQICQIWGMLAWDDQDVAGIDGLDIHKGHDTLILVYHAGRGLASQDLTEDTGFYSHDIYLTFLDERRL